MKFKDIYNIKVLLFSFLIPFIFLLVKYYIFDHKNNLEFLIISTDSHSNFSPDLYFLQHEISYDPISNDNIYNYIPQTLYAIPIRNIERIFYNNDYLKLLLNNIKKELDSSEINIKTIKIEKIISELQNIDELIFKFTINYDSKLNSDIETKDIKSFFKKLFIINIDNSIGESIDKKEKFYNQIIVNKKSLFDKNNQELYLFKNQVDEIDKLIKSIKENSNKLADQDNNFEFKDSLASQLTSLFTYFMYREKRPGYFYIETDWINNFMNNAFTYENSNEIIDLLNFYKQNLKSYIQELKDEKKSILESLNYHEGDLKHLLGYDKYFDLSDNIELSDFRINKNILFNNVIDLIIFISYIIYVYITIILFKLISFNLLKRDENANMGAVQRK